MRLLHTTPEQRLPAGRRRSRSLSPSLSLSLSLVSAEATLTGSSRTHQRCRKSISGCEPATPVEFATSAASLRRISFRKFFGLDFGLGCGLLEIKHVRYVGDPVMQIPAQTHKYRRILRIWFFLSVYRFVSSRFVSFRLPSVLARRGEGRLECTTAATKNKNCS